MQQESLLEALQPNAPLCIKFMDNNKNQQTVHCTIAGYQNNVLNLQVSANQFMQVRQELIVQILRQDQCEHVALNDIVAKYQQYKNDIDIVKVIEEGHYIKLNLQDSQQINCKQNRCQDFQPNNFTVQELLGDTQFLQMMQSNQQQIPNYLQQFIMWYNSTSSLTLSYSFNINILLSSLQLISQNYLSNFPQQLGINQPYELHFSNLCFNIAYVFAKDVFNSDFYDDMTLQHKQMLEYQFDKIFHIIKHFCYIKRKMMLPQNAIRMILNESITYPNVELLESFMRVASLISLENNNNKSSNTQVQLFTFQLWHWVYNSIRSTYCQYQGCEFLTHISQSKVYSSFVIVKMFNTLRHKAQNNTKIGQFLNDCDNSVAFIILLQLLYYETNNQHDSQRIQLLQGYIQIMFQKIQHLHLPIIKDSQILHESFSSIKILSQSLTDSTFAIDNIVLSLIPINTANFTFQLELHQYKAVKKCWKQQEKEENLWYKPCDYFRIVSEEKLKDIKYKIDQVQNLLPQQLYKVKQVVYAPFTTYNIININFDNVIFEIRSSLELCGYTNMNRSEQRLTYLCPCNKQHFLELDVPINTYFQFYLPSFRNIQGDTQIILQEGTKVCMSRQSIKQYCQNILGLGHFMIWYEKYGFNYMKDFIYSIFDYNFKMDIMQQAYAKLQVVQSKSVKQQLIIQFIQSVINNKQTQQFTPVLLYLIANVIQKYDQTLCNIGTNKNYTLHTCELDGILQLSTMYLLAYILRLEFEQQDVMMPHADQTRQLAMQRLNIVDKQVVMQIMKALNEAIETGFGGIYGI